MRSHVQCVLVLACVMCCQPLTTFARPLRPQVFMDVTTESDQVGDVEGTTSPPAKVLQDTIWIADWNFDVFGGGCTDAGWVRYDNRILYDGSNYWSVGTAFDGTGGISGNAAILSRHDLMWARDGYGNSWDYSIILKYRGASTLTFDYLSDTEPGLRLRDSGGRLGWCLGDAGRLPDRSGCAAHRLPHGTPLGLRCSECHRRAHCLGRLRSPRSHPRGLHSLQLG